MTIFFVIARTLSEVEGVVAISWQTLSYYTVGAIHESPVNPFPSVEGGICEECANDG